MAKRRPTRSKAPTKRQRAPADVDLKKEIAALRLELAEALERQTATADVLKVISRSAFDLQPVLDSIVETASRLCDAEYAIIYKLKDDDKYHVAANNAADPVFLKYAIGHPLAPGRGSLVGRTALERKTVHMPDCLADPEYVARDLQSVGHYRSVLGVPLLREGVPIGVVVLMRAVVLPFTDKQIELVTTFADQAVIAIENVRLFDEVQARTRDLSESLQQQTATADVLKIISSSPGELAPVFQSMLENATRVCGANFGQMNLYEEGASVPLRTTMCQPPTPPRWRTLHSNRTRKAVLAPLPEPTKWLTSKIFERCSRIWRAIPPLLK